MSVRESTTLTPGQNQTVKTINTLNKVMMSHSVKKYAHIVCISSNPAQARFEGKSSASPLRHVVHKGL
jgi:predicted HAD superfamily phosphohydrolase